MVGERKESNFFCDFVDKAHASCYCILGTSKAMVNKINYLYILTNPLERKFQAYFEIPVFSKSSMRYKKKGLNFSIEVCGK